MPTMLEISQMNLLVCIRADNAPGATPEERKALRRRARFLRVQASRARIKQKLEAAKPGEGEDWPADTFGLFERLAEYEVEFPTNQPTEEPASNGSG